MNVQLIFPRHLCNFAYITLIYIYYSTVEFWLVVLVSKWYSDSFRVFHCGHMTMCSGVGTSTTGSVCPVMRWLTISSEESGTFYWNMTSLRWLSGAPKLTVPSISFRYYCIYRPQSVNEGRFALIYSKRENVPCSNVSWELSQIIKWVQIMQVATWSLLKVSVLISEFVSVLIAKCCHCSFYFNLHVRSISSDLE